MPGTAMSTELLSALDEINRNANRLDETITLIDDWNHRVVSDDVRAGGGFGTILEPADDGPLTTMLAFVGREG
jgi:hypothetical protein